MKARLFLGTWWRLGAAMVGWGGLTLGLAQAAPLLAIDVGHSLNKPGAYSAHGRTEFAFNLDLAQVVQQTLAGQQVETLLIGADGAMDHLTDRSAAAGNAGASLFLSLHHDSAKPRYLGRWQWQGERRYYTDRFSGFSLFVSRINPEWQASLACATAIGMALKQAGFHSSAHHAKGVAGEAREWANKAAGVYFFDDLVVLKNATMPALLLEAGVIVNRRDELKLQQTSYQQAMARAVAQGVTECHINPLKS
jgi:N-acetylmuramoyl-L-alanine amidase